MSRVFLLEEPDYIDISKAKAYGETVFVFDRTTRRCSIFDSEQFGNAVLSRLRELKFSPTQDAFCVTGRIVPLMISAAAMVAYYGKVTMLFYNTSAEAYVERTLDRDAWLAFH